MRLELLRKAYAAEDIQAAFDEEVIKEIISMLNGPERTERKARMVCDYVMDKVEEFNNVDEG